MDISIRNSCMVQLIRTQKIMEWEQSDFYIVFNMSFCFLEMQETSITLISETTAFQAKIKSEWCHLELTYETTTRAAKSHGKTK